MEKEDILIEHINLDSNIKKKNLSIQFWLRLLKKSWPIYIIMVVFTSLFVFLYIISGNVYQFYAAIFYPIIMFLIFVSYGIYKNVKYLKSTEKELKTIQVDIYSTHLLLSDMIKGINHNSKLPYEIMEKIFYVEAKEEIVFEVHKKHYFSLPKKAIKKETFDFLTTLFSKETELEE
ncbi:MAG: hypothetical protein NC310_06300 [Roseburia sp.]|nr:hypothetical protein [Anaeroplasma bactoclasticum]MCM1196661.1 hypothetical protein [Roseburia sp.]